MSSDRPVGRNEAAGRTHPGGAMGRGPTGRRVNGFPLPGPLRHRLERLFAVDLSTVRIHLSRAPERHAALAFARGEVICLLPECWQPATPRGLRLLAHELAHVVQQRDGRVRTPRRAAALVVDPALEAEAEQVAERIVGGRRARLMRGGGRRCGPAVPVPPLQPYIMIEDVANGTSVKARTGKDVETFFHPETIPTDCEETLRQWAKERKKHPSERKAGGYRSLDQLLDDIRAENARVSALIIDTPRVRTKRMHFDLKDAIDEEEMEEDEDFELVGVGGELAAKRRKIKDQYRILQTQELGLVDNSSVEVKTGIKLMEIGHIFLQSYKQVHEQKATKAHLDQTFKKFTTQTGAEYDVGGKFSLFKELTDFYMSIGSETRSLPADMKLNSQGKTKNTADLHSSATRLTLHTKPLESQKAAETFHGTVTLRNTGGASSYAIQVVEQKLHVLQNCYSKDEKHTSHRTLVAWEMLREEGLFLVSIITKAALLENAWITLEECFSAEHYGTFEMVGVLSNKPKFFGLLGRNTQKAVKKLADLGDQGAAELLRVAEDLPTEISQTTQQNWEDGMANVHKHLEEQMNRFTYEEPLTPPQAADYASAIQSQANS